MALEFRRTSRFNPEKVAPKLRKVWISQKPYHYKIVWRREVFGVSVPGRFQVTLLSIRAGNFVGGQTEMWSFVDRPLYKTLKKAVEACERHQRIWDKAIQCPSMRALRSLFQGRKPYDIPKWAFGRLDRKILGALMDRTTQKYDPNDDDVEHFESEGIDLTPEPELELERRDALEEPEPEEDDEIPVEVPVVKKRGRPKGSKNVKTRSDKGTKHTKQSME